MGTGPCDSLSTGLSSHSLVGHCPYVLTVRLGSLAWGGSCRFSHGGRCVPEYLAMGSPLSGGLPASTLTPAPLHPLPLILLMRNQVLHKGSYHHWRSLNCIEKQQLLLGSSRAFSHEEGSRTLTSTILTTSLPKASEKSVINSNFASRDGGDGLWQRYSPCPQSPPSPRPQFLWTNPRDSALFPGSLHTNTPTVCCSECVLRCLPHVPGEQPPHHFLMRSNCQHH